LLRNYGHVFAVMMRLRQLCCHKELLPVKWKVSFSVLSKVSYFNCYVHFDTYKSLKIFVDWCFV
jgi:hypothetical protein